MTLYKLIASCPCGGLVAVVNLYVSDEKALYTTGMCTTCDQQVKTQWPLRELYQNCPKSEREPIRRPVKPPLQLPPGDDLDFLHSMGISDEPTQA